jgi:uncharacterized protein
MNLIIFIKNPILGKVKTRLAASVGAQKALQIYDELCGITQNAAEQTSAKRHLFYSDFVVKTDKWLPVFFEKYVQLQADDLGERMSAAFETVFATAPPLAKTIIIGTDCPSLSADILAQAFDLLDLHDVVIGPAADGGYYLLGMKTHCPELFADMVWSTNTVCAETVARAKALGLGVHLLPVLSDIDTETDYLAWKYDDNAGFL